MSAAEPVPMQPRRDPWEWYSDGKPTPDDSDEPWLDDEPTFEPFPRSHSERGKASGVAKRALPESRRRRP